MKPTKKEIYEDGHILADYPIDENMDGELESNGSTQCFIEHKGIYYFLQVGWDGTLGRLSKIKPTEFDDDDSLLELINEHEGKNN